MGGQRGVGIQGVNIGYSLIQNGRSESNFQVSHPRCVFNNNPLTPKDPYRGGTALLTSKRCSLYIYSTNIGTEYFKHGTLSVFSS